MAPIKPRWWGRGNVNGLLGLALDDLIQILPILALCRGLLGCPDGLVVGTILPASGAYAPEQDLIIMAMLLSALLVYLMEQRFLAASYGTMALILLASGGLAAAPGPRQAIQPPTRLIQDVVLPGWSG